MTKPSSSARVEFAAISNMVVRVERAADECEALAERTECFARDAEAAAAVGDFIGAATAARDAKNTALATENLYLNNSISSAMRNVDRAVSRCESASRAARDSAFRVRAYARLAAA